jgi:hypothetical protein
MNPCRMSGQVMAHSVISVRREKRSLSGSYPTPQCMAGIAEARERGQLHFGNRKFLEYPTLRAPRSKCRDRTDVAHATGRCNALMDPLDGSGS